MAERARHRMGRRGAMLLTLGITYLFIGASMVFRPQIAMPGLDEWVPVEARVGVWVAAAAIAILGASVGRDKWAWLALYVPPALRVLFFGFGEIAWLLNHDLGSPLAWVPALGQVPIIVTVVICSGWREPPPLDELPAPGQSAGRDVA